MKARCPDCQWWRHEYDGIATCLRLSDSALTEPTHIFFYREDGSGRPPKVNVQVSTSADFGCSLWLDKREQAD